MIHLGSNRREPLGILLEELGDAVILQSAMGGKPRGALGWGRNRASLLKCTRKIRKRFHKNRPNHASD